MRICSYWASFREGIDFEHSIIFERSLILCFFHIFELFLIFEHLLIFERSLKLSVHSNSAFTHFELTLILNVHSFWMFTNFERLLISIYVHRILTTFELCTQNLLNEDTWHALKATLLKSKFTHFLPLGSLNQFFLKLKIS